MTVLLTGFEPYGGYATNPSAEIARALDGEAFGEARVTAEVLPVVFSGMTERIEALMKAVSPRAVICLGLAPGDEMIRLERIAANVLDFDIADNAGETLQGPVRQDGVPSLRSTLPLAGIERRIAARGIPVRGSDDAGRYLCNAVLYLALCAAAGRSPPPCGFIHLPFATDDVEEAPCVPLDRMIDAVRIAIATTLEDCQSSRRSSVFSTLP